ncbi:MAG: guanylate kinase [Betaproteobacteria bacterium]|nr:guanylate kinase [Betaproteobacteria bacterium]
MPGNLLIVTAPSGAGKTSLVQALLRADSHVELSVSYTTRAPRPGEIAGRDYHFVSKATFERMASAGEFLESAEVYGNHYGTSRQWIQHRIETGQDILLEIDWQGAAQVRRLFPEAIGIFILPPSLSALRTRLTGRGQDSEEVIERRLKAARDDMSHASEFDYVIINNDFEEAVGDLAAVVRASRLTYRKQLARDPALFSQLT